MTSEGYPVFGANGKIGFSPTYTHEEPVVLVGCRGSCGSVHLTDPRSYANGNAMALDHLDKARIDICFLKRFLRYRGFADVISGTSQPQIIRANIVKVEIPVPPLSEQKRIAKILDAADASRARRRDSLDQLDALVQSTFLEMFGDPFTNLKGWEIRELSEVVAAGTIVTYGIVQAGKEFPSGVPYIRTGDIVEGEIRADGLRHTAPGIAKKFERSKVRTGEIVMSIRATVGTTAQVPRRLDGANLTQGTARISPGDAVVAPFLLHYIRSQGCQEWLQRQIKGATFREITLKRLRQMPVFVPPLELQTHFATIVQSIEQQKTRLRAHLAELDALFASLQARAFAGEL